MLEKAFELAVVFSAVDNFSSPVQKMASQLGLLDEKTKAVQQRMNEFKNMAFVGGAITAAGAALVKVMENGLNKAGDFLTKTTMIRDAVGATADQMDRINKVIRESSGRGIFSIAETQGYAQQLATSGFSGSQIEKTLPLFTQYAEVQKLGKGADPSESIKEAVDAAHTIGAYDPSQLLPFLDKYNKATFMQAGSSSEFSDTFKYISSRVKGLGISSDDMLTMSALANRVGLAGSIGGTESADMILRTIPGLMSGSGKKDSKQTAALKKLGLANTIYDKNGKFLGIGNLVTQLAKARDKFNPVQFAKLAHDAFGQQGMGIAEILGSKSGKEQLDALAKQMKSMKSISQMQEDINKTPEGQMLQLKTNLENLKLNVWLELAKILNPIFMWLNKIVSKVQEFADAHPKIAKLAAEFMTFAAAAMLIIGPIMLIVGALGYLKNAGLIGAGFKMLGGAFKSSISPIMLLVSAGYLLYQAWKTDFGGIREKTKSTFDWIKKEIPVVEKFLNKLAKSLGFETSKGFQIPGWLKVLMGLIVGGKTLNLFAGIGGGFLKALSPLSQFFKYQKALGGGKLGSLLETGKYFSKYLGKKGLGAGGKLFGKIGRSLFGNKTVDLAKFISTKGIDLGKIIGKKGIDLGKLIGKKGINLTKLISVKGFNLTKLIGKKGISLAKLINVKGFNLAKLIGGKSLDLSKFIGKQSLKALDSLVNGLKKFGPVALDGVKKAGQFGLTLLKLGANALISAGKMAAAWVIGLGPIGWIITGVIAALALLWAAWHNNWGHIREHFAGTVKWIIDKWNVVKDFFKNLPKEALDWGKNFIEGFVKGVENNVKWLKDKITGFFKNNVVAPVKNLLGIHSPSTLMNQFGKYTIQGFANGMNNNLGLVKDASSNLTDSIQPGEIKGSYANSKAQGGYMYIAPGAIVINPNPNQSSKEIAEEVIRQLGKKARNNSLSRPTSPIPEW